MNLYIHGSLTVKRYPLSGEVRSQNMKKLKLVGMEEVIFHSSIKTKNSSAYKCSHWLQKGWAAFTENAREN